MLIKSRFTLDTNRFYLSMGGLILAAWALLLTWQRSSYAELLGHEALEHHNFPPWLPLAAFLLSWLLMSLGMMLPGALPSLYPYWRSGSQQAWLIILGYLTPWMLVGTLAYLGDNALHHLTEHGGPLAAYAGWIAPGIVLLAGLYQLTPFKRRFAERCRPEQSLHTMDAGSARNGAEILRQGLQLGFICVGSCGLLMLLMFAIGHDRLDWMLALAGLMAAERLAPWGQRLAWLVGLGLVVWAGVWMMV